MRRSSVALLWGAAWAVVAGLAVAALLRVVAPDSAAVLVGWNARGSVPYLLAAPALLAGFLSRRRALAISAAVTLLAGVVFAVPQLRARNKAVTIRDRAPGFDLLTWNLDFGSGARAAAGVIKSEHPDLLLLQEVTPESVAVLGDALGAYPYVYLDPRSDAFGGAIASVFPLEDARSELVVGLPMLQATMQGPAGPLHIVNVHTRSAVGTGRTIWSAQLAALGQMAAAPGPPSVMAGDFNADWGNKAFHDLVRTKLTDAAASRGQLWSPTWPAGALIGPVLRLDHILTTSELTVTSLRRGPGGGSDHRALKGRVVTVAPPQDPRL